MNNQKGEQSISIETNPYNEKILAFKQLVSQDGGNSYLFTSTIEDNFVYFKTQHPESINEIFTDVHILERMQLSNFSISPSTYDDTYNVLIGIQSGKREWQKRTSEKILISITLVPKSELGHTLKRS
ncbi:hypothetical protein GMMP15_2160005 [Candidatus Magnetomoraceae bacterium gMMP-15]